MSASDWIGLLALLLGGGGLGAGAKGGLALTAKLTRLIVAVENAVEAIKAVVADVKEMQGTVNAHAVTLAEHGQQLQQLHEKPGS